MKVSPWPSAEALQQQNMGHSRNTGVLPAKDRMDNLHRWSFSTEFRWQQRQIHNRLFTSPRRAGKSFQSGCWKSTNTPWDGNPFAPLSSQLLWHLHLSWLCPRPRKVLQVPPPINSSSGSVLQAALGGAAQQFRHHIIHPFYSKQPSVAHGDWQQWQRSMEHFSNLARTDLASSLSSPCSHCMKWKCEKLWPTRNYSALAYRQMEAFSPKK